MNPFTQQPKRSIFNEDISDPKMSIRANVELYDNVINVKS
jgi:hypothetical protein